MEWKKMKRIFDRHGVMPEIIIHAELNAEKS